MKFVSDKRYTELYSTILKDKQKYAEGYPFPYIVLDDFFDPVLLQSVSNQFPKPDQFTWWKYNNPLEKKFAKDQIRDMPHVIRTLLHELMEKEFVDYIERLTGISGLIVDHHFNGAGLHQCTRGGKLDIHADYNYHPKTHLHRRLNILIYLNELWGEKWNGNLEFWDREMTECKVSIPPLLNRMVVFSTTDFSFHGLPDPLECPDGISRKSIALYYYTADRPAHEKSASHSTIYMKRPQDAVDPELDALRQKRAIRRI